MAILPKNWHYRVSAGTGWPGVNYCDLVGTWCGISISVLRK